MAHELNKAKIRNDVILTISLLLSMVVSECIMHMTKMHVYDYDVLIFFVLLFILIKIFYNLISKFTNKYIMYKKMR